MKKLVTLGIFLCFALCSLAQKNNKVKAYLDFKQFYNPEIGNYVEVYLQFVSYSLKYKEIKTDSSSALQSEIALSMRFKNAGQLVASDAYRLQSPLMKDSVIEDFYEIKRFALKPGTYSFELDLLDLNASSDPVSASQDVEIVDLGKATAISNIEAAEVLYKSTNENLFSKSGYDIVPRISNYYSNEANKIPVYMELYADNSVDKPMTVGLKQTVYNRATDQEIEYLSKITKYEITGIQPVIRALDISKLPSGEYLLAYSIIDLENKELSISKYEFDRYKEEEFELVTTDNVVLDPNFQKSITDDSLAFYIESLIPICKPAEIKNVISLLKTKDKQLYRKYLQSFWVNSTNNQQVYERWLNYKGQVMVVQKLFGNNFQSGYETDRGRVYLQYGAPSNVITKEVSSTEVPYEVWRYDKIGNMSNRKFIFYNPDLTNNAYRLLHSDVRGEVQNYRWQQYLQKRGSHNTDAYDNNDGVNDFFGGQGNELFNQY